MPLVKADAYGHGAVEVVRTLRQEGIRRFGVAFLEEALELKKYFPDLTLMVIGPTLSAYSEILVEEDIIPEICQWSKPKLFRQQAVKLGKTARIHLKIDTAWEDRIRENALEDIVKISPLPGLYWKGSKLTCHG